MRNSYSFNMEMAILKVCFVIGTRFTEITDAFAIVVNIEPIAAIIVI